MRRDLTPEEETAYDALAQAAARLREAQIRADEENRREADRPEAPHDA